MLKRRLKSCRCARWPGLLALGAALFAGCQGVRQNLADQHIREANRLAERQDLHAAIEECERAARVAPHLSAPYSNMGHLYQKLGDTERAIQSFLEALRRDPYSLADAMDLGALYQATRRVAEAIQTYLMAVQIRPSNPEAHLRLGDCYVSAGDYAEAAAAFEKAIQLSPQDSELWIRLASAEAAQGKSYEALRAYRDALERGGAKTPILVAMARIYLDQGRLTTAVSTLDKAVELDPGDPEALEVQGFCCFRMGDYVKAQTAYEGALKADPDRAACHAGIGAICMLAFLDDPQKVDKRELALEYWHRSLECDPDQPRIKALIQKYGQQERREGGVLPDPDLAVTDGHQERP